MKVLFMSGSQENQASISNCLTQLLILKPGGPLLATERKKKKKKNFKHDTREMTFATAVTVVTVTAHATPKNDSAP